MSDRIATLTELRKYHEQSLTLEQVLLKVETEHGLAKIFEHSPKLMKGLRFRYHVMPLDKNNKPITKLAKGANL